MYGVNCYGHTFSFKILTSNAGSGPGQPIIRRRVGFVGLYSKLSAESLTLACIVPLCPYAPELRDAMGPLALQGLAPTSNELEQHVPCQLNLSLSDSQDYP